MCVCSAPNCCDTEERSASQPGSVASGTHCITNTRASHLYKDLFHSCSVYLISSQKILDLSSNIKNLVYSGPSKVEHNPFQEGFRLSICSAFKVKGMSRTMLCNAALMVRLLNFYSSFKPNFFEFFFRVSSCSRIKTFDFRGSNVYMF
jgi:hypothetical protein